MHEHLWIWVDFDGGEIEVCSECGRPRHPPKEKEETDAVETWESQVEYN